MRGTTKPVATAFTLAEHVAPIVGMFDMIAGGDSAFAKRPFVKAHISLVISPMRFGADVIETVNECLTRNTPLSCITAAQAGATAPVTLAGFLAQSLAENLASLVMVHATKPGHPMVFSNWPLVIDLRTGAFAGGGGEIAVLKAAHSAHGIARVNACTKSLQRINRPISMPRRIPNCAICLISDTPKPEEA